MSGVAVAPRGFSFVKANFSSQALQQQFEGTNNTAIVSESPVSSVGGWRHHGNLLRPKHAGVAF